MRVLSAQQMREADRETVDKIGIPAIVLMETAGHQVVSAMRVRFGDLAGQRVSVLCGCGNNGGDGFVVARLLSRQGVDVQTVLLGRSEMVRGEAATNLAILRNLELPFVEVRVEAENATEPEGVPWDTVRGDVFSSDLLVDAILGTGLSRPVRGMLRQVIADVNESSVPVVAVDTPTGLSSSALEPADEAIEAALTVTFAAPKLPLVTASAKGWVGELVIADIGIPESVIAGVSGDRLDLLTPEDVGWLIPPRRLETHKGEFGHVLVVAGSVGKAGAAVLAALGALRSGAGRVTVATPRRCLETVASGAPDYMTLPLPDSEDGTVSPAALETVLAFSCDVIAAGPGLGTTPAVTALVTGLVERTQGPLVLDADALTVLADHCVVFGRSTGDIVVTPHPGEMARLCDSSSSAVQADRLAVARRFASDCGVTVILKGAHTVVASPDGRAWINQTGNPGMATGGVGDVLTGSVAAWLVQLGRPDSACQVAVYVHGLAGDIAINATGATALTATDLASHLGLAVEATLKTDSTSDDLTSSEP